MKRRDFIKIGAASTCIAIAGCAEEFADLETNATVTLREPEEGDVVSDGFNVEIETTDFELRTPQEAEELRLDAGQIHIVVDKEPTNKQDTEDPEDMETTLENETEDENEGDEDNEESTEDERKFGNAETYYYGTETEHTIDFGSFEEIDIESGTYEIFVELVDDIYEPLGATDSVTVEIEN